MGTYSYFLQIFQVVSKLKRTEPVELVRCATGDKEVPAVLDFRRRDGELWMIKSTDEGRKGDPASPRNMIHENKVWNDKTTRYKRTYQNG